MYRVSPEMMTLLLRAPVSGMGYQRVDVTTTDGRQVRGLLVFNAELLEVPDEVGDLEVAELCLSQE